MRWQSRTAMRNGDGGLKREKLISSCVAEKKEFKGNGADCGDLTSDRVFVRGVCNPSSVSLSYFVIV